MKSSSNSGYLKKIGEKITGLLKKSPNTFEDEDFHKLRVEIKKLKAVAGFIELADKNFSKRGLLKPFSKIYKQAGKIRELQLQQTFLQKQNDFSIDNYLQELLKKTEKEKKKFAALLTKQSPKKIKKPIKKIENFLKRTNENDAIRFTNNEKRKIVSHIKELPLKKENAHKLRKILKEDFYNRKRTNWPSRKIKQEDDFLQLLGNWHDTVVLNQQLEKIRSKTDSSPAEVAALQKIKSSVSSESQRLFNEINSTLGKGVFDFNSFKI